MKRGLIFILLASLVALSACGGRNQDETKTEISLEVSGDFAVNYATGGTVDQISYYLVLKVSALDINPPLVFVNPNYVLGSNWYIAVPNGYDRLFELSIYELKDGLPPSGGFDNLTAFVPIATSAQRTFNLTGGSISIPFPMEKAKTGSIGTNLAGQGIIKIARAEGNIPAKNCAYKLQAYLMDPAIPNVTMGPATINMGSASSPGKYLLTNIPLNKTLKLKIVRTETDWSGTSDPFVLNSDTTILPVDVVLSGWDDLKIVPEEFPVPDGDVGYLNTMRTSGGWQASDGNTVSHTLKRSPPMGGQSLFDKAKAAATDYALLILSGSTVNYEVAGYYGADKGLGLYGANTVDNISVYEKCDSSSSATTRAWWYRKPMVSYYAGCIFGICDFYMNAIPLNGGTVFIHGDDFDNPRVHGPKNLPEPFLDTFGPSGAMTPLSGSTYDFDFKAPSKTFGNHHFWVRNNRSNPLFPDFEGFFDTLDVWYSDTAPGPAY